MNSLEAEVEFIQCMNCHGFHIPEDREEDGYNGTYCPDCGTEGNYEHTGQMKQFRFWSVALYETGQAYGGPEEGGWYYSTGNLVEPQKIRVFEDVSEAIVYKNKLRMEFAQPELRKSEDNLVACGFSGKLPVKGWPDVKPRYC